MLLDNASWPVAAVFTVLLTWEVTQRQTWTRDTEELAEVFAWDQIEAPRH